MVIKSTKDMEIGEQFDLPISPGLTVRMQVTEKGIDENGNIFVKSEEVSS